MGETEHGGGARAVTAAFLERHASQGRHRPLGRNPAHELVAGIDHDQVAARIECDAGRRAERRGACRAVGVPAHVVLSGQRRHPAVRCTLANHVVAAIGHVQVTGGVAHDAGQDVVTGIRIRDVGRAGHRRLVGQGADRARWRDRAQVVEPPVRDIQVIVGIDRQAHRAAETRRGAHTIDAGELTGAAGEGGDDAGWRNLADDAIAPVGHEHIARSVDDHAHRPREARIGAHAIRTARAAATTGQQHKLGGLAVNSDRGRCRGGDAGAADHLAPFARRLACYGQRVGRSLQIGEAEAAVRVVGDGCAAIVHQAHDGARYESGDAAADRRQRDGRRLRCASDRHVADIRSECSAAAGNRAGLPRRLGGNRHAVTCARRKGIGKGESAGLAQGQRRPAIERDSEFGAASQAVQAASHAVAGCRCRHRRHRRGGSALDRAAVTAATASTASTATGSKQQGCCDRDDAKLAVNGGNGEHGEHAFSK